MKFLTLEELQREPERALRDLVPEEEWVVTVDGRPVAVLAPVREEQLAETLAALRRARALAAVTELQRLSSERGLAVISPEEIDEEIQAARRTR
ncbi:MAG TPA: type II toxin-antitoxin system Phd/YefM family antitoxin [Thermoanaerobaculia bacterium]|nr:type II toxin-antitoxin system Phd/YefM family antitoxin [Thermoanaerobaculia bacterium]